MKTATVTWITYNNYGTLLQAYALQKAIEQLGHENVILSDNEILKEFRASRVNVPKVKRVVPVESPAGRLERLAADPGRILRSLLCRCDPERYGSPYEDSQKACGEFRKEALKIRCDVAGATLPGLNEDYDAFVCGSDQVWSVFDNNFNPYYYLDFAQKRKIAYAPSLGTDQITPEKAETLRQLLADFSAVSVRESGSAKQLSEITGRQVQWVADPTLLHDREFWSEFASELPQRKKKYLLCYFLEHRAWYISYARKLARKLGLKLLLIPSRWDHLQHSFVADFPVGPREFAALFRDASYVLTDSYHGSIFSLIFEKDFQYLQRFAKDDPNSQNIRVESLFGYLDLQDRVAAQEKEVSELRMDYEKLRNRLDVLRSQSRAFLSDALQSAEDEYYDQQNK